MSQLKIEQETTNEGLLLRMSGSIDESSDFDIIPINSNEPIILDLDGIQSINSLGIRSWVVWMKKLSGRIFILRRCSRPIMDQINILEGFLPTTAIVESFYVPYVCDECGLGESVLFRHGNEFDRATADRPELIRPPDQVKCTSCSQSMEMDVIEAKYFRFLKSRRSSTF